MARADDPHGGTSQFYVNVVDNHALDPSPSRWGYAVFGRVVEGMDVVKAILVAPVSPTKGEGPMKGQMLDPEVKITKASRVKT